MPNSKLVSDGVIEGLTPLLGEAVRQKIMRPAMASLVLECVKSCQGRTYELKGDAADALWYIKQPVGCEIEVHEATMKVRGSLDSMNEQTLALICSMSPQARREDGQLARISGILQLIVASETPQ